MTRNELAVALAHGAAALRYRADLLPLAAALPENATEIVRTWRASADLLEGVDVEAVSDELWARFDHEVRARARTLQPPTMLEPS